MPRTRASQVKKKGSVEPPAAIHESDDDAPEVVHSNAAEVLMLRELHEQSSMPKQKKRRVKRVNDIETIDASILEAAAAAESVTNTKKDTAVSIVPQTPPQLQNSKKMYVN